MSQSWSSLQNLLLGREIFNVKRAADVVPISGQPFAGKQGDQHHPKATRGNPLYYARSPTLGMQPFRRLCLNIQSLRNTTDLALISGLISH